MKKFFFVVSIVFITITVLSSHHVLAIGIGDPFPVFSKPNTLTPEECAALNITPDKEFSLNDITYEVTVLEFLNVYCHTCRQQVQIFNEFYKTLREDPELSGKVCIIGIAVGNTAEEIRDFKNNFKAAYPILPDTKKEVFNLTGNVQGTPHTYILRKEEQRFVIDYHAGGVASPERYLETVRFALRGTFTGTSQGNKIVPYAFRALGKEMHSSQFAGKPVILYFPVNKKYPVENDTRNRGNQIKILHDIRRRFPEVTVIAFQGQGVTLPQAIAEPGLMIADELTPGSMETFRKTDSPTVYFVNQYGRISFKGEAITLYNAEAILKGKEYKPELKFTDQEIIRIIEQSINAAGNEVDGTEKEILENGKPVFITTLKPRRDGVHLFSILESKLSLCDICHDSHFILVFDQEGIFRNFIPIQLTKLGNIQWTEEDRSKINRQIIGKSMFSEFSFNPKADAVSTATMSSSLIYDALNDGKKVFANYKNYKFRYEYWKEVCFANICTIKAIASKTKQPLTDDTVARILAENKGLACPHDGTYVILDNNILCSIHGLHTKACTH